MSMQPGVDTVSPSPPVTVLPAVLDGGRAVEPTLWNIGAALARAARTPGPGRIEYLRADGTRLRQDYPALLEQAGRLLGGLRQAAEQAARGEGSGAGLVPGATVVLQISNEPDLLAAFWACVLGGYVPVPVRSVGGERDRPETEQVLLAVCDLLDDPWVVTGRTGGRTGRPPAGRWLGDVEDLAVLLLTSGSTGRPKAVMLTHRNILSRCAATAAVNGLTPGERSFNWMPLDHVGGLVMFHVRDVYLRCTQVHAPMRWILADPTRWLDGMHTHRSTVTWAPNFAFGLVVDHAAQLRDRRWDLSSLRYIMNGGEPVKPRTAARFLSLLARHGLPSSAMYPGWGMSETSSGVVDRIFDPLADERFVSVGRPHPGVRLRVVDEGQQIVEQGRIGRLQVDGEPITAGYFNNPAQNRQSFTDDGWFRTGDLAYIVDGLLTVTGRLDDLVEVGDVTYHGHEIESAVEELGLAEPSYVVACSVPAPHTSGRDRLTVAVRLRDGVQADTATRAIRELIHRRFGGLEADVLPVEREAIPKTGIGKPRRAELRDRLVAARLTASDRPPGSDQPRSSNQPRSSDQPRGREA
ncbi:AMP-binding protein [Frankia sp. CcI49]|uniref:AMP-binding protein n=1 Tax=Frankia sp. CcI49 TaxID=1745382 RepID=UPI001056204C|nr:AMP-binding protein [Frankia sp. CcI49]